MSTFVTLENLRAGISGWKSRRNWSQDFHSGLYDRLDRSKQVDPSLEVWWQAAVVALGQWKALRSCVPGINRAFIHRRGLAVLPELHQHYQAICEANGAIEPDLAQVRWELLEPLLKLARDLKGARSWMFASKLGHFLLPSCVVVTDGAVTPIVGMSYYAYWQPCREAWQACANPEALIAELQSAIEGRPAVRFPWPTKITELCYAGARSLKPGGTQVKPEVTQ